jgi:amino acid transporter
MSQVISYEVAYKGLKGGAISFVQSTAVGMASTAPAFSLASTLGWVVVAVGLQTPLLVVLAFIPMFLAAWAIKVMNSVDPDCGTSFTWSWRALGPKTGWFAGGWGTIAADLLAMASQAQIAGQYLFLLFGVTSIGANASSVWVLLVGILWILALTWICYLGIEISVRLQVVLIVVEVAILLLMAIVALIKVGDGTAPIGHLDPSWSWLDPLKMSSPGAFMQGMMLMVFIYWGWDTTTSINEETADPGSTPGKAGVVSTFLLLGTYLLVTVAVQAFAGIGTKGIGLGNPHNANDVLSVMGSAVFGHGTLGLVLAKLLIFMILTSSAATTQTTILPNARTMFSMAFHKALPKVFGRIHPRFQTPTVSTVSLAVASVIFYASINFVSHGNVLADSVTSVTFFVAMYLGISGFASAWHFRHAFRHGVRDFVSKFLAPGLGGVFLFVLLGYSIYFYADPSESFTTFRIGPWHVGAVFFISVVTALAGVVAMLVCRWRMPAFFEDRESRYGPSLTESGAVVALDREFEREQEFDREQELVHQQEE